MNEKREQEVEQAPSGENASQATQEQVATADLTAMLAKIAERDELQQRLLRLQADFDNFRRRTQREKEDLSEYAGLKLITGLLPVIDNYERALAVSATNDESKGILQGVQMIHRQLVEQLQREGLAEIDAQGQPFDPNLHEAIMQTAADGINDNTVVEILQKGYRLKERVIRQAMVKVART